MKRILVHLDASPNAAMRLTLAQGLAKRHGAELAVQYGVLPSVLASPWGAGEGMAAAVTLLADLDAEQRERARALYDKLIGSSGGTWLDGGASPYWALLQQALYADLIVFGQHDPQDPLTGALPPDLVPSAVIDTGRPALVVPYAGSFENAGRRVLIAWKPTREAARAVLAALPWLRDAAAIHVAVRPEAEAIEDGIDHLAALRHWLQLHGVGTPVQAHGLADGDVGEQLLSLAADTGADLLVMGCYGHARSREWLLGGVSRTVLRSMTLPVLIAH